MGEATGYQGQSPTRSLCGRGMTASLWRYGLPLDTRMVASG